MKVLPCLLICLRFLNCRIQEKYRKMVDKVINYRYKQEVFSSLESLILLEEIEDLFWEITHLVGMLHEIERKWNVNLPAGEPYRDTTTTIKTTTTKKTRPRIKAGKAPKDDLGTRKVTRKKKKSTPFLLKEFFEWTSTRGKTPRWSFRQWDYGWELNYDWWNVHPLQGRVAWEPRNFYIKHPLP